MATLPMDVWKETHRLTTHECSNSRAKLQPGRHDFDSRRRTLVEDRQDFRYIYGSSPKAEFSAGVMDMTIDKSLRVKRGATRNRSVMTRVERIQRLREADRWKEGDSPLGLPKVRVRKLTMKKKKKKKEDEEGATAEGGAAAAPAAGAAAKPAAGSKPAAGAKAPGGKK
jgi:small basic protein (TIGR04137 family)